MILFLQIKKLWEFGGIMVRGFVTLATGKEIYYKMAANLLASFRLHNPEVPFAIICDRENKYTELFDDVVVLEKANGNYMDKFSLLIKSPYDESIFIEPDCLIYRNLDFFWDLLSHESDCSSFGWNEGGLEVWFKTEETRNRLFELVPELNADSIVPLFNPGYVFIRKGHKCQKMFEDCINIVEKIKEDSVLGDYSSLMCGSNLRDDPIFSVAMGINGFLCHAKPSTSKCIALPSKYTINKIDIIKGKLDVTDKNGKKFEDCALLHYSTRKAMEEGLYLWQIILVGLKSRNCGLYKILNNNVFYELCALLRKIKRIFKHILKKN